MPIVMSNWNLKDHDKVGMRALITSDAAGTANLSYNLPNAMTLEKIAVAMSVKQVGAPGAMLMSIGITYNAGITIQSYYALELDAGADLGTPTWAQPSGVTVYALTKIREINAYLNQMIFPKATVIVFRIEQTGPADGANFWQAEVIHTWKQSRVITP